MLALQILNESAGALALANTLAQERYNGVPLRDLDPRYQMDLVLDAKDMLERYREQ